MKINLNNLICVNENIDIDSYIKFREYIKKHMDKPDWLRELTKDELATMLVKDTKVWIYYIKDEIVCSMLVMKANEETMLKYGLALNQNDTIEYGSMIVNPKYVGNNLQFQMLLELEKYSKNNNFKYAIGAVHPLNVYSINNLLKNDFKQVAFKELERGPRNIYFKKIN